MTGYRSFLDRFEEAVRALPARSGCGRCADGCTGCCRVRSVLPVEALPLLDHVIHDPGGGWPAAGGRGDNCPFLVEGRGCGVPAARPFVCRTHGLPILFLDPDGAWAADGCPREKPRLIGPAETDGAFPLHVWNAELNRINREFSETFGVPARRIPLSRLACAPEAYLPLLERIPERERRTWGAYPAFPPVFSAPVSL